MHDNILINFVSKFDFKQAKNDPSVTFYAYDKNFHLQKVSVRYNFVMNHFEGFELSGIMRKKTTE